MFKYFTDAEKLAVKNGYEPVTGRIFYCEKRKRFVCVIKVDGIIKAFTGTTKGQKTSPSGLGL